MRFGLCRVKLGLGVVFPVNVAWDSGEGGSSTGEQHGPARSSVRSDGIYLFMSKPTKIVRQLNFLLDL